MTVWKIVALALLCAVFWPVGLCVAVVMVIGAIR